MIDPQNWALTAHALRTYEGLAEKYLHEVESLKNGIREHFEPGYYDVGDYYILVEDDGTVEAEPKEE